MVLEVLAVLRSVAMVVVVLAIKVLITLRGLSRHLIWPPKVWLVLDFLQNLMHWFSEYGVDSLCIGCSGLPYKVPLRAVAAIPVRPKILPLWRDNLLFSSFL